MTPSLKSPGVFFALAAAILFGLSTPLAKILLRGTDPVLLASLLYLGSAVGFGGWLIIRKALKVETSEAPIRRPDLPWLAGAILAGGVAGPLLLMLGLQVVSGFTTSLLLNMEGVFTIALAWFVFREHFDRRIAFGALSIVFGGVVLSWGGGEGGFSWSGILLILGACLAWGIDNNLTRHISGGDPIQIAFFKGLIGGLVNLLIWVLGSHGGASELFSIVPIVKAGILGFGGYGVSLVFFILALRHIGTARTGAYFSTAPFIGSIFSVILLGDILSTPLMIAAIFMAFGVWLHLSEQHKHSHKHEEFEHEHSHLHDDHHRHTHADSRDNGEPHSHRHHHQPIVHTHRHFPDLHHRHSH